MQNKAAFGRFCFFFVIPAQAHCCTE